MPSLFYKKSGDFWEDSCQLYFTYYYHGVNLKMDGLHSESLTTASDFKSRTVSAISVVQST